MADAPYIATGPAAAGAERSSAQTTAQTRARCVCVRTHTCRNPCKDARIPVFYDLIFDRVRSRWLTFLILCMLVDQLYLQFLIGTPSCRETMDAQTHTPEIPANGTGNSSVLWLGTHAHTLTHTNVHMVTYSGDHAAEGRVEDGYRETWAPDGPARQRPSRVAETYGWRQNGFLSRMLLAEGDSGGSGDPDPISAILPFRLDMFADRASIARYVAVPLTALANARYQSPHALAPAAIAMTVYVALAGVDEVRYCGQVGDLAREVQAAASAASQDQQRIDVNGSANGTDIGALVPVSLVATGLWLVVFQQIALWLVAVTAAALVWYHALRRLKNRQCMRCHKPQRRPRSYGTLRMPDNNTGVAMVATPPRRRSSCSMDSSGAPSPLEPAPATAAPQRPVHSAGLCTVVLKRISRAWKRASAYLRAIPQRPLVALGLTAVLVLVYAITLMSQLGGLATWAGSLLNSPRVVRGIVKSIVDEIAGEDSTGATARIVDLVVNITTLTLEAVYSLLLSLILGIVVAMLLSLWEIGRALMRYRIAHFEILAAQRAPQTQSTPAVATPTDEQAPASPYAAMAPRPWCSRAACAARCQGMRNNVAAAVAPCTVWSRPGGVQPDGSLDMEAFSFYSSMSYIPFVVVNMLLAFTIAYILVAAILFVAIFRPSRNMVLGWLLTPAFAVAAIDWVVRRVLLNWMLADKHRIYHPRCFLFFDFVYSTSIGVVAGLAMAVLRVLQGALWSVWRCMQLDEPLLPGPLAYLDSGWTMHGSVMKCAYANGVPPAHHADSTRNRDCVRTASSTGGVSGEDQAKSGGGIGVA